MVSLDAETRIKALNNLLFPVYVSFIVGHTPIRMKQWYAWKMVSNTSVILALPDCNEEEMREVFERYVEIIKESIPRGNLTVI